MTGSTIDATTDAGTGLSSAQVADRVARGLTNSVPHAPTRTIGQIIRGNVFAPINLVVGILAALVIAAGSPKDALFAGVIVANSVIGVYQELRAKRVLDQLSVINAPRAHAVRDGQVRELQVHELVQDDVVELRAGAQVVADGVVLVHDNLEIDESLLTGEADPVVKSQGDEVLSGSAVVAGTGRMMVTKVGAENYAARLAEEARRFTLVDSPLRNDVNRIVKWVGYAIIPVGLLLASSQFLRRNDVGWRDAIISTVAGLIGMVPEGLVLLTSVAFFVGVVRLAKRRCLVQEMPAIEVLARVDVLCADKTGTITEGSLEVAEVIALDGIDAAGLDEALAAIAHLDPDPNATSRALQDHYPSPPDWTLTGRVPFSSGRKWSAMSFQDHGNWVLGAPENVLTTRYEGALRRTVEEHAALGQRVLVLASTPSTFSTANDAALPSVEPVALVLLDDVVRADAPATLRYFADQGVIVKVISGDNNVTVGAVARRAGLDGWEANVNATTLPADGTDEFADAIEGSTVFGRVTPHQKRAMVQALQSRGHIVAMTGDGVNDVLALKDANCGIAMASGSEATRGVAQLVLLDSNFSALPAVVAEGRRVINNIERVASLFLVKTTYSIVLSILTGVFALNYPLRPIHLTILSWFTIGLPAFFLALEPNDRLVQPDFLRRVLGRSVPAGLVIAGSTMGVFAIAQLDPQIDADHARTVAVLVAGAVALMNLYRVAQPMNQWRLILIVVMSSLFGLAFVFPSTQGWFELPRPALWAYVLAAAFIVGSWPLLVLGSRLAERWHRTRLS